MLYCIAFIDKFSFFIFFITANSDIRWKCYKNMVNSRTKKENIEIYENGMLSVIKVGGEPTKWTNRERKSWKTIKHNEILIQNNKSFFLNLLKYLNLNNENSAAITGITLATWCQLTKDNIFFFNFKFLINFQ